LHAHHHHRLACSGLTSLSYIPQVRKALRPGSTDDLSSKTLAVLAAGLALWVGYGVLKDDIVIMVANAVSLTLVATLIGFKIRDAR
jgi:MtN3 and saliva related transmembrane protein